MNRKPVTKPVRSYEKPVKTKTEIKIPLKREEIENKRRNFRRIVVAFFHHRRAALFRKHRKLYLRASP